jgi:septal ring factor EnvC (AmiA/AmiB activator)
MMKYLVAFASLSFLIGCEVVQPVPPKPDVKAVVVQNNETKQHIQKTRTHIQKSQDVEKQVDDHLNAAENAIDQLLNMPSTSPVSNK